jgi:hypothetical protein
LKRAPEVARVKAFEAPAGEPGRQTRRLTPAFVGKRRVELALDPVIAVPRRLPVADEDKARGNGTRRDGELRGLRARRSYLDAYTNFLSIPDRARPISGE